MAMPWLMSPSRQYAIGGWAMLLFLSGCGMGEGAQPAGTAGDSTFSVSSGVPASDSAKGTNPPETAMTAEQITKLYKSWSKPVPHGSWIDLGEPKVIPDVVPEFGIIVSAYIPHRGGVATGRSREIPASASKEQVQAAINEFLAIPGAIVDWSFPPSFDSVRPNDVQFNPNQAEPNQEVPFSRIGLCCSPPGIIDGWDLVSQQLRNQPPVTDPPAANALSEVNIAVIDTGLMDSQVVQAEIGGSDRFIGGWDAKNTAEDYGYGPGQTWEAFAKSRSKADAHGSAVASLAVSRTDNLIGIAGAAGVLPTVKYGMFRYSSYEGEKTSGEIPGEVPTALGVINNQVTKYRQQPTEGYKWNIVTMSFGNGLPNKVQSKLFDNLADNGVLAIAAAGNQRNEYSYLIELGKNPIHFPASDPNVIAVASWGTPPTEVSNSNPKQWNYQTMYGDKTSNFSSASPFIDIAAPGVGIPILRSLPALYANNSEQGTSVAAPILAGVAATMISMHGQRFQCPAKSTVDARRNCVEQLRAALLGSSTDITDPADNPSTQGSGVIDAPAAFLNSPNLKLPPRPQSLAIEVVGFNKTTRDLKVKLTWKSAREWVDGSDRVTLGPIVDGYVTTYRLYLDGDPTRQVDRKEVDLNRVEAAGPLEVRSGEWIVPREWTNYRVPLPVIEYAAGYRGSAYTSKKVAAGDEVMFSVTEINTYKDSHDREKRQVESLPISLICKAPSSPDQEFTASNCRIHTG